MATHTFPTTTTSGDTRWLRWANFVLGAWLFISAYVWIHSPASFTNTWIVGLAIAAVSLISAFVSPIRWVNTALAVWLFISTLFIGHATVGTAWHNAILAIFVFGISLVPSTGDAMAPRGTPTPMTH